ncbi:MAG: tyrosine-type recombinase/integrase [Verrucomicrobiia bacterium]|jgi:site-specific recombinase XerD
MSDQVKDPAGKSDQQILTNCGDNLYRSSKTGIYYSIFTRDGKQKRKSLKTRDRQIAQNKVAESRGKVGALRTGDAAKVPFAILDDHDHIIGGYAKEYAEVAFAPMLPATLALNTWILRFLAKYWKDKPVRSITKRDCENWMTEILTPDEKGKRLNPSTFNQRRELLQRVFAKAVEDNIRLDNPMDALPRLRVPKGKPRIPTREEFRDIVHDLSKKRGGRQYNVETIDLLQLLAYSGCRLTEIVGHKKHGYQPMTWGDVNFQRGEFTVTGKGRKTRTNPMSPSLRNFLLARRQRLPSEPKPTDRIISISTARKGLQCACNRLGLPPYDHHDLRHFFASNCVELGMDYMVIAKLLGHDDGGKLVAAVYGHLRQDHLHQMAQRMTWTVDAPSPVNIVDMPQGGTGNSADVNADQRGDAADHGSVAAGTGDADAANDQ